jgi:cytochrome c oxidase subunit II
MNRLAFELAQIQFFPDPASDFARAVDLLFWSLIIVTGGVLAAIAIVIVFLLVKYRRSAVVDRSGSSASNVKLEIAWSVVPFAVFVGMFGWGASLYFRKNQLPKEAIEIHVLGKQWMWKLQHLQGQREINQLHVPVGKTVRLMMTSQDVIHSFFLPAFRIKQDVVPGKYTTEWFRATKTGTFPIYCAQYCGNQHALMIGQVIVLEPEDFVHWLENGTPSPSVAVAGENLFRSLGCSGCHASGASVRAPLLNGVYGSPVPLQDGRVVQADEQYLRDCLLVPQSQVVAGYDPVMPSFAGRLTEEQLFELITYLKSIGGNRAVSAVEAQ